MQCFGCFNHRPTRRPDVQSERDARLVHHETENSAYERLVVRLNAETATLIGEDGLQTDVPQNVLQRSEHLCNALNNILTENATKESSIVLPSGVLQGWLGSLRELAILQDDASATVAATAPGTFLEQSAWYLKVRVYPVFTSKNQRGRLRTSVLQAPRRGPFDLRRTKTGALDPRHQYVYFLWVPS